LHAENDITVVMGLIAMRPQRLYFFEQKIHQKTFALISLFWLIFESIANYLILKQALIEKKSEKILK